MDSELHLEAKKLENGDQVVFITRHSPGYAEFMTIMQLVDLEQFHNVLEKILKTDLSLRGLIDNPVDEKIGQDKWLVIRMDKSKSGNYYRSARIESLGSGTNKRSKFWMNFTSLRPLCASIGKILKRK